MSSINPHYTFNYAQTPAYRFSHDSVFLARRAFEAVADRLTPRSRILDLCAGCGVVGLECMWHLRAERGLEPAQCDFVEIQSEYADVFAENRRRFGPTHTRMDFLPMNYADLHATVGYDVVLCNPPYFRLGSGKESPSRFKTRCRFFVDADWSALEACVRRALNPGGDAFVLTREPARNKFTSDASLKITRAEDVRGTALWHVHRVND